MSVHCTACPWKWIHLGICGALAPSGFHCSCCLPHPNDSFLSASGPFGPVAIPCRNFYKSHIGSEKLKTHSSLLQNAVPPFLFYCGSLKWTKGTLRSPKAHLGFHPIYSSRERQGSGFNLCFKTVVTLPTPYYPYPYPCSCPYPCACPYPCPYPHPHITQSPSGPL